MTTENVAPPKSLVTKLAEVMGEVERVAKHGRNDFHKYDYATEADITSAVRQHMALRHLMIVPSVEKCEWRANEKGSPICTLTVRFTVLDGDAQPTENSYRTGADHLSFTVIGEGQDSGDKATYKAMTGATKYALLKLFLIPTGDDPEREGNGGGPVSRGERREAARAQSARDAAEHGPYSDRERERAAKGVPMIAPPATPVRAPVLQAPVIDKETGEVLAPDEEWLRPSWVEVRARRAALPPELQAVIPDDESMHAVPPVEAMEEIPFMVDAIIRKAKERKISPKEWGDIMERFFGSKRARLLNNDKKPVAKLSPYFVRALYLEFDMGRA